MTTLNSVPDNPKLFTLDGIKLPRIYEVYLDPNKKSIHLKNINTGFNTYNLGSINQIVVNSTSYDTDEAHINRIQEIVY